MPWQKFNVPGAVSSGRSSRHASQNRYALVAALAGYKPYKVSEESVTLGTDSMLPISLHRSARTETQ